MFRLGLYIRLSTRARFSALRFCQYYGSGKRCACVLGTYGGIPGKTKSQQGTPSSRIRSTATNSPSVHTNVDILLLDDYHSKILRRNHGRTIFRLPYRLPAVVLPFPGRKAGTRTALPLGAGTPGTPGTPGHPAPRPQPRTCYQNNIHSSSIIYYLIFNG